MTLTEVIKASKGQPFKLPSMTEYLYTKLNGIPQEDFLFWANTNKLCGLITVTALISNEWEIMSLPNNILEFPKKKEKV